MLSVEEAKNRILAEFHPLPAEEVPLEKAHGRVLAEDLAARLTQPPADVSAMDGYALRAQDCQELPVRLKVAGEAAAGHGFGAEIGPGEALRIFTGAPLPRGADAIAIQENCTAEGEFVLLHEGVTPGRFIRPRGMDFAEGERLLSAGQRLSVRDVALAAAMNHARLKVHRRPRVGIISTGDELCAPGGLPGPGEIVSSNGVGLAAFVRACGGEPVDLGIVPDNAAKLEAAFQAAEGLDFLVTSGGASVGDHDLVRPVLAARGDALDFWKIAMRPGKPLMFGRCGGTPLLGLPGNPVSSFVCALVFLRPALARLLGLPESEARPRHLPLAAPLPENDRRQEYMRAVFERDLEGRVGIRAFDRQDSSLLARLAQAEALIVRPPFAPAAKAGELAPVLPLDREPGGF